MMMGDTQPNKTAWLDRPIFSHLTFNVESALFALIMLLAIVSRFYDLGARVVSHDETSHVYFSWLYEQGNGYSHDPVTHGPLQFHLVALSYFIFGDSDFTARIPVAVFSIATIAFLWRWRETLGRAGALIASSLFLISPYMVYYGRYVRNEAYVGLFGVITLWAILRYLESGHTRYIYWLTMATVFHFITKETSFIYTAQALIFLAFTLVYHLSQRSWVLPGLRNLFLIALIATLLLLGIGGGMLLLGQGGSRLTATETLPPAIPGQSAELAPGSRLPVLPGILVLLGIIGLIFSAYLVLRGYSWANLRGERAFGLLVILGTMVLPMLAPFPVKFLGYNPIDYQNPTSIFYNAVFTILFALIAVGLGLVWNARLWLANAAIFYGVFTIFYTSLFTNGFGFVTGLIGSLGYWLEQQNVNRGSQPWYYYLLVQVPIYEFLPAMGSIFALLFSPILLSKRNPARQDKPVLAQETQEMSLEAQPVLAEPVAFENPSTESKLNTQAQSGFTAAFLGFWSITSLIAYTIAGEKMPWLTVHIALPMLLLCAWFLGRLVELIDWDALRKRNGVLVVILVIVFLLASLATIGSWLGPNPPFQGQELANLQSTSTFVTALLTTLISGWLLSRYVRTWNSAQLVYLVTLMIFGMLGLLTMRTAFRAAYINYDNATEYLVYAHMARGPKDALTQIEEISRRTTNGLAIRVAYDDVTTYPYWWYLRNYTNKDFFGKEPTRAQREAAVILVGDTNYSKIEPVVGQAYQKFEYTRIWWPNQDYFGMTRERILEALTDPNMRAAIFKIWLYRDYSLYSQLTNQDFSLSNWQPSQSMRLYVRKDIVSSLWNYGVAPSPEAIVADPYEGKQISLLADRTVGSIGTAPGQFSRPRDVAVAADGSIYVADTENHRIQHLSTAGEVLHVWGSFAAGSGTEPAPPGTFNEPWGLGLGPDGSVYVADTWNNRIQKFSPAGQFITTWGYGISQSEDPFGFYGPRDVAVNSLGEVFVTDTGNKRVVVFDSNGNFIAQFGGTGLAPGQFDEPVGLTIDAQDRIYVADTWNQRVQVFVSSTDSTYLPLLQWDIVGWYGSSVDNKPFIAVDNKGNIFVADPEGYRVLQFTNTGDFVRYWGELSTGLDGFSLVGGVGPDNEQGIWVVDTNNNRLMHFNLPDAQ